MEEFVFLILVSLLVLNFWYLLFKLAFNSRLADLSITKWIKQPGNLVRLGTWLGALIVGSFVWSVSPTSILGELRGEIAGIAITVILIDELVIYRNRLERKQELFKQIKSPVRDMAVEALRLIREEEGWFEQVFEQVDKKNLRRVQWERANLSSANLEGADLRRANLEGIRLWSANLEGADLRLANLKGAYLWSANLKGAYLGGANLEDANLVEAKLERANLEDANLVEAKLEEANLENANLINAKLTDAKYSAKTIWPAGFDPHETGAIEYEWDDGSKKYIPVDINQQKSQGFR